MNDHEQTTIQVMGDIHYTQVPWLWHWWSWTRALWWKWYNWRLERRLRKVLKVDPRSIIQCGDAIHDDE